jgi:syntaxin 16
MCSLDPCHVQSRSQLIDQQLLEPDLRARDRELSEIAKSIATLAELFKDLSSLVIDQGTLLDSVEYNIEQTGVHMGEAVKELEIATRFVLSRVCGRWAIKV